MAAASWTGRDGKFWMMGGEGTDANGANGFLNDLWEIWSCRRGANIERTCRDLHCGAKRLDLRHDPERNHLLHHQRLYAHHKFDRLLQPCYCLVVRNAASDRDGQRLFHQPGCQRDLHHPPGLLRRRNSRIANRSRRAIRHHFDLNHARAWF